MGLSYDIISEFVKITNDNKEKPKEGTVYATVVSSSGGKYVKIDGSDLLTPMDTTADIEDGERVTLTIKDHKAIVTGNVTSPSASTSKVDKVSETVSSLSDRVGTFELVVADKISTKELEAYKATIEVLIAQKASIENLNATNAEIDKLKAKDAQIENLVADKATISDLQAVNATIENLKAKDVEIENAVIDNLEATTADIRILSSDFAQIKTLVNGNLTSDNILSFNITSEKVTMEDAFIKDAMIDTISAGKINAGEINTNWVSIGSEDGAMTINGSTQQFRDKNGNVRIQIGQDASGDFTFILYGEDGTGQLINQNGITASAIGSGLIVNDMVSDNAAIAGGKLDISSVITEINNDNSTTIKSNKIYLNEQEQSLEVAFNSLKTKVDTIQEVTIDGDLAAVTEQVQSNTTQIAINKESIKSLVSEDTVLKKQVSDLNDNIVSTEETLTAKYTTLEQNLEGFQTNVADTYATKASVNDVNNNLSKNYSTTTTMNSAIAQKASEITASVASTYATKNEVKTLNDNLEANYSTTEQMESAIAVAKEEIDLSVSSIYETKTESTSKANKAKADAISAASTDASTKANKAKADAISAASTDASTKANKAKADAISAASTDATSKVNAAKTELNTAINKKANSADVYTKTETYTKAETDSKIKIAKDAIDLSVSTTYETKTNVEDKITDALTTAASDASTKANNAKADAISAASTDASTKANKAKADAISAASTDASTKANKAKADAISAASTDATSKVNAAKTELNTAINKKANSADVYTKTETYTKAETDSKIKIAKDAIDLSVSTTYETKENTTSKINNAISGIQVGATNLWVVSDTTNGYETNGSITSSTSQHKIRQTIIPLNGAQSIVYQCWNPNRLANSSNTNRVAFYDADSNYISSPVVPPLNGDTYQCLVITVPSNAIYIRLAAICGTTSGYDTSIKIKFELGNKPTDYSIAPEDLQSSIDAKASSSDVYTKEQTDSKINIAKDAIDLSVSQIYETKMNVESMVTNTLGSAKSYADTKKTEAISAASTDASTKANKAKADAISAASTDASTKANKAKADAISAASTDATTKANNAKTAAISAASTDATSKVNAAKTELNTAINKKANSADVYTKTETYTKAETDSKIKIAKDAIDLSVSTTYETKENTTSKINNAISGIQVGATNLWVVSDIITGYENKGNIQTADVGAQHKTRQTLIPTNGAKELVYQCWNPNGITNEGNTNRVAFFDSSKTYIASRELPKLNGQAYQHQLIDIPENSIYMRLGAICGPNNGTYDDTIKIKFELGNKATSWSPAPEDVKSDITSLESETSSIKQTVTSLQLGTDNINATVKSLSETLTSSNQNLAADIESVQNQVNMAMTSDEVKMEIKKELVNGVNKVTTSTGYVFDQNGLSISKSGSEMETKITEDGMKVFKNDEVMLTANNQGVDAKNLHATTYLIIGGNSRMEDFKHGTEKRTAVFWIG